MRDSEPSPTADGDAASAAPVGRSFPDLVWAHHVWEARRRPDEIEASQIEREAERRYREALAGFENEYGEFVSAYWSRVDASAVGVTVRARSWYHMGDSEVRFHRATDWATREAPAIPEALDRCERLALKAEQALRSTSELITVQWIFTVASHLLGLIERSGGRPDEADARRAARESHRELDKVEAYYQRAGMNNGRIVYTQGMLLGVVALVLIVPLIVGVLGLFHTFDTDSTDIRTFFACYAAGALGAIVSVMTRMASSPREGYREKFTLDFEVGRPSLLLLGGFRPLVGAISGFVVYFAFKAGFFQTTPDADISLFWYTTLAFAAGFSERFTVVVIARAEGATGSAKPSGKDETSCVGKDEEDGSRTPRQRDGDDFT